MESHVARRVRPARSRAAGKHREAASVATVPPAPAAAPAVPARAQPAAPTAPAPATTKITMTDYGYVAGELRRIAILTAFIIALLLVLWVVVG
jgi:hypothetical protein